MREPTPLFTLLGIACYPYGAALADQGRRLYITNQHDDTVSVYDPDTLRPLQTLTGFGYPEGIAALAATHRLQVVHVTDYLVILR